MKRFKTRSARLGVGENPLACSSSGWHASRQCFLFKQIGFIAQLCLSCREEGGSICLMTSRNLNCNNRPEKKLKWKELSEIDAHHRKFHANSLLGDFLIMQPWETQQYLLTRNQRTSHRRQSGCRRVETVDALLANSSTRSWRLGETGIKERVTRLSSQDAQAEAIATTQQNSKHHLDALVVKRITSSRCNNIYSNH